MTYSINPSFRASPARTPSHASPSVFRSPSPHARTVNGATAGGSSISYTQNSGRHEIADPISKCAKTKGVLETAVRSLDANRAIKGFVNPSRVLSQLVSDIEVAGGSQIPVVVAADHLANPDFNDPKAAIDVEMPLGRALAAVANSGAQRLTLVREAAPLLTQALARLAAMSDADLEPEDMQVDPAVTIAPPRQDLRSRQAQEVSAILRAHGYELPAGVELRIPETADRDNATEQVRRDNTEALSALSRHSRLLLQSALHALNAAFPTRPVFDAQYAIERADKRRLQKAAGVSLNLARGRPPRASQSGTTTAQALHGLPAPSLEAHTVRRPRPRERALASEPKLVTRVTAATLNDCMPLAPAQLQLLTNAGFRLSRGFGLRAPASDNKEERNAAIRLSNTVALLRCRPTTCSDNAFIELQVAFNRVSANRPLASSLASLMNAKQVLIAERRSQAMTEGGSVASAETSSVTSPAASRRASLAPSLATSPAP